MEPNKTKDFKTNVADLTKIPPNEFEKYFQEWIERDDVARSLQAKLRCDLIKNFNKTNLGKHILSHTMSSTGGSTMRLTLSPLVLALNTLVAEFLYAQNCHFTLSVFCTEIPFRNTLPDFESMRRFRFNHEEICEIWQAVTGSKVNKRDLNKTIIQTYETNSNTSLLLLIIKSLLKKDPLEQLKRNAEVQTEMQERSHKSISAQSSEQEKKSPSKTQSKDDNLHHINQYLLTLSQKVIEMTREFEQFAKQRHESRSRTLKTSRSRDYQMLNKSLERITENMKAMTQAKRKNKRLSCIVESIDNLTQQFGKCAQNFDNVTKVLSSREENPDREKKKRVKVKLKEKQTETEIQEKSYAEWIHEMRNTENGQKFLNRVEISLRKALAKHREQLQSETDIKMKHLKSLMRLHYQQKLSKHLLQDPKINLEETRKCNDTIEKKLQQFEKKQMELLQKLQESSLELREAQLQQKECAEQREKQEIFEKEVRTERSEIHNAANTVLESSRELRDSEKFMEIKKSNLESIIKHDFSTCELRQPVRLEMENIKEIQINKAVQKNKDSPKVVKPDHVTNSETPKSLLRDVSKAQNEILDMAKNIAEQGRSVDHIIYDAKLRIQQLENESNQLEQNFQSYLERRKRSQELDSGIPNVSKIYPNVSSQIINARLLHDRKKPLVLEEDQDEENDKEFQRIKETLEQIHQQNEKQQKSAKSDSSTSSLEIRNAILEAKLKFFEHQNTIRKCKEQREELRSGNLLQKQLEKYPEIYELPDYFIQNFGQFASEADINVCLGGEEKDKIVLNLESNLSEINIKDKSLDEEQDIKLSPMMDKKSQKLEEKQTTGSRRELFPQEEVKESLGFSTLAEDLRHKLRYREPIPIHSKELTQALKGDLNFMENSSQKPTRQTETTSQLIKQSMAKMQQLFEQQSKSQEALKEMVNEIAQERDLHRENLQNPTKLQLHLRPNDALDKSLTTTMTSTTTATTNTTQTSEDRHLKNNVQMKESITNLNRSTNTSMPSMLNLSCESEESMEHLELEMTQDTIKETNEDRQIKGEFTIQPPEEVSHITVSSESSDLHALPSPAKKPEEHEPNFEQEFGQINDSPRMPVLNLYSPGNDKEIGEIFLETDRTFEPIVTKISESSSTRSSSDLEISTGHQNKNAKNLGEDSESDFWA